MSFENEIKDVVIKIIDDNELSKKNTKDICDYIWDNKEEFGELMFNVICSYYGDEIFYDTFKDEAPEVGELDEDEEESEEKEDEE